MAKQIKGTLMMLFAAMCWGLSFVAQVAGMEFVGPFTFTAARMPLGFVALLPVIFLRARRYPDDPMIPRTKPQKKHLLAVGARCGALLFVGSMLQQFGLLYLTAGKSGFITALYVLIVPLFGVAFGRKPRAILALAAACALAGLYLLCIDGPFALGAGEILTLLGAVAYAAHIVFVDRVVDGVDGVRLAALQFFFCGLLALPCALIFEQPTMVKILDAWLPIVYSGLFSCGVAFTIQMMAQKIIDPTLLAITMCTESVFSALFEWLLLGVTIPPKGLFGCALMFFGILAAQLGGGKQTAQKAQ